MSVLLALACGLLVAMAARELWAEHGEEAGSRLAAALSPRRLSGAPGGLGRTRRAIRAGGLEGALSPALVVGARALGPLAALPGALWLSPAAPGRSGVLVAVALPAAAALLPDLALRSRARRREAEIRRALPDLLELIAVGAAAGRAPRRLLADAATAADGPLRAELAIGAAELAAGRSVPAALEALAQRGGGQLAPLALLLERSRRLGAPLADGLRAQAAALREDRIRATQEQAERAAPKIQLAVALLLVPSVMLIVAAAIIAHGETLLIGF